MKMARDFFMGETSNIALRLFMGGPNIYENGPRLFYGGDLQNSPATFYGGDLMQGGHDFLWGGDLPIKD